MALSKTKPSTPAPGKFEEPDTDTVGQVGTDAPAANDAPAAPPPAAATPAASPAPAPAPVPAAASGGALATSNHDAINRFKEQVEEMKGAADFSHGNFPVFKGITGEIKCKEESLGRWVKGAMLAWDDHTQVSPGSDSEKAKEAVGYSKDGETLDNVIGTDKYGQWVGKPVDDYLNFLREDGDYPHARKDRYVDVAFMVLECENGGERVGQTIQITLSKSSIPSFEAYQQSLKMAAMALKRNIPGAKLPEDPFTFYFIRESAAKGDKSWTKLRVSASLPAKI